MMRSKLEYGYISLPSSAQCHLQKLERAQNSALRTILGRPRETPIRTLLEEAKISTIENRLKKLAKNWYEKSRNIPHHPITINKNQYEYDPNTDKIETIYNKLRNL